MVRRSIICCDSKVLLKNSMQVQFEDAFCFYFWLILVEAPCVNVVAMATREIYLSLIFVSKHHLYTFRISHKVSRKNLLLFRNFAPKTSTRVKVPLSPKRVKHMETKLKDVH